MECNDQNFANCDGGMDITLAMSWKQIEEFYVSRGEIPPNRHHPVPLRDFDDLRDGISDLSHYGQTFRQLLHAPTRAPRRFEATRALGRRRQQFDGSEISDAIQNSNKPDESVLKWPLGFENYSKFASDGGGISTKFRKLQESFPIDMTG